jgi:hypothetical protein
MMTLKDYVLGGGSRRSVFRVFKVFTIEILGATLCWKKGAIFFQLISSLFRAAKRGFVVEPGKNVHM